MATDTLDPSRESDSAGTTHVSVVVATFRRLDQLGACLDGIAWQTLAPYEVLVITHRDPASAAYVEARRADWPALKLIEVAQPGSIAAYNAGLAASGGELVAYIDDDAVPAPDWLERIAATFERDPLTAAVGGRDVISISGRTGGLGPRSDRQQVGRIQWSGRMTANHHVGSGPSRDVDVLKGVNMSFRRREVAGHGFDPRLLGPGAVVHAELSICLPLRRRGLRVIYDPAILVMHHPAPRPAGDHRDSVSAAATFAAAHNEGLEILDLLDGRRRWIFVVWSMLIGSTESPGLAALARDVVKGKPAAGVRFLAAQRGRLAALRTCRRVRPAPGTGISWRLSDSHDLVIETFKA